MHKQILVESASFTSFWVRPIQVQPFILGSFAKFYRA